MIHMTSDIFLFFRTQKGNQLILKSIKPQHLHNYQNLMKYERFSYDKNKS